MRSLLQALKRAPKKQATSSEVVATLLEEDTYLPIVTKGWGALVGAVDEFGKLGRVQMAGIENAHEVRDRIRGHLRRYAASTGLGDLDDHDDDAATPMTFDVAFMEGLRGLRSATSALRAAMPDRSVRR